MTECKKTNIAKMRERMVNNANVKFDERREMDPFTFQRIPEPMRSLGNVQDKVENFEYKGEHPNDHFRKSNNASNDPHLNRQSRKDAVNMNRVQEKSNIQTTEPCKRIPEISTERHPSLQVAKYQSQTKNIFKNLYGEEFFIPDEYHRIEPPVIPSFLVVTSCLADGISPIILGRGSYGRVLKANFHSRVSYKRDIVVKEIFDHRRNVETIFKEARILLFLERTGYVPVCFGVVSDGDVQNSYGILQECIGNGVTLDSYLWKVRGKISSIHLLDIARQMAEGLKRIHDMGVLINDIKANNVLVNDVLGPPEVKFCDMGLATFKRGRIYKYTSDADEFGHLAPEVRYGGISSFTSDVYSLGYLLDLIQDFGEFNQLYPAIDKCFVDNPRKRSDASEVSEIVASIYNQRCLRQWERMEQRTKDHSDFFVNPISGTEMKDRTSCCVSPKTPVGSNSDLCTSPHITKASDETAGFQRDPVPTAFSSSSISTDSCIQRLEDYDADCESDASESQKSKSFKARVVKAWTSKLKRISSITDKCRSVMSADGTQYKRISDTIIDAYVLFLSQNQDNRIFTFWAIICTLFFTTLFKVFLILKM